MFRPAALVFRADGINVTRHVGDEVALELKEGDRIQARLDFGPLQLGDGSYLLSVGLYKALSLNDTMSSEAYDLFDRSFEFSVPGAVNGPGDHTVACQSSSAGRARRARRKVRNAALSSRAQASTSTGPLRRAAGCTSSAPGRMTA